MKQSENKTSNKIFLIEDDELTIKTVKFVLEREGYEVLIAKDGELAMNMLDKKVDLILLDLVMPLINGFELLKIIRQEKYIQTPVIVISNLSEAEDIKRAFELGATDYLVKNELSIKAIAEKIRATLEKFTPHAN